MIDSGSTSRRKKGTAAPLAIIAGAMGVALMAMTETMAKVVAEGLARAAMQHHAESVLGATLLLAILAGVAAFVWLAVVQLAAGAARGERNPSIDNDDSAGRFPSP